MFLLTLGDVVVGPDEVGEDGCILGELDVGKRGGKEKQK